MLNQIAALLRGASDDIVRNIAPAVPDGAAPERLEYVRQLLVLAAAEIDLVDIVDTEICSDATKISAASAHLLDGLRGELCDTAAAEGIRQVRARLAQIVHPLSTVSQNQTAESATATDLLKQVFDADARWRTSVETARATLEASTIAESSLGPSVSPLDLAALLNTRLSPRSPIEVTEVRLLPGGRSKQTFVVSVAPHDDVPSRMVLRQDASAFAVDTVRGATTIGEELPILNVLSAQGYPVPRPILFETEANDLGQPFILLEHCEGSMGGDRFSGFFEPSRPAFEDLAAWLARVHATPLHGLGFGEDAFRSSEDLMNREVTFRWQRWRRDAVGASPIIECAFAWLLRECSYGLGTPSVVHGDAGPHNLLIDNGRISAILDWELVHPGDPAEDLAYIRSAIEKQFPWPEFLDIYYRNGGQPTDERRLKIFTVYVFVRNASLSAGAARAFIEGESDDFMIGAIGVVPIPFIENQLITLIGGELG